MIDRYYGGAGVAPNPIRTVADRLGLFAYSFAVTGGRPDWSLLFGERAKQVAAAASQAALHQDPFADTVPLDPEREREKVAGQ